MGDVVIGNLLEGKGLLPGYRQVPDIYIIMGEGDSAAVALSQIQKLRRAGYNVEYALRPVAFGKQFNAANDSGAKLAVILGEAEVEKGVAKVKHLESGEEEEVHLAGLVAALTEPAS